MTANRGFEKGVIAGVRNEMRAAGKTYVFTDPENNTAEFVRIQFIGTHEGREVVCDAMIYTLRMEHESAVFELAEQRLAEKFPRYQKMTAQTADRGPATEEEEEMGMLLAELMMGIEEDEEVKVSEHVEIDTDSEFGIGLDIGLHVEAISPEVIARVVDGYNNGGLVLDPALYSFQTGDVA